MNQIQKFIKVAGSKAEAARIVGVTRQAFQKWEQKGDFPTSEYTGDTNYRKIIKRKLGIELKLKRKVQ